MDSYFGLGPPDLCRLSKQEPSKDRRTYFHHVVGLDTGNLSSITAYLTGLMDTADDPLRIDSATYCTWDVFSRSDIRVTVKMLSGTSNIPCIAVHLVTAEGTPTSPEDQVSTHVWEGTFLSSYLRSHAVDWILPDQTSLNTLPSYRSVEDEQVFQRLILKFITQSHSTGIPRGSKRGTNIFVSSLCEIFIRNRRFCIDFFSTFQNLYPPIVTFIALCHIKLGNRKAALSVLLQALTDFPEDDTMLTLMSEILARDSASLILAGRVIQGAISVGPGNPWVWLQLAEVCRGQKKFDQAILALNNALDDLIPSGDYDTAVAVSTVPRGGSTLQPMSKWGIGSYCELWPKPRSSRPESFLSYCPIDPLILGVGSGLTTWFDDTALVIPSVQQDKSAPNLFRKISLSRSDKKAYKILVRIREDLGWDVLMDLRRSVFGQQKTAEAALDVTGNTSIDRSFDETAFFEDHTVNRFGSSLCCRRLDRFFHLLRDDLESMFALKKEIKDGILQAKISPEGLCRRIETCSRFHKQDYLEICCRVYLGIRKCFDPFMYRQLTKVYLEAGKERETFMTIVGLWNNVESKIFPTGKNFSVPPWLAPSIRTQGYRPYNHCPPWLIELIGLVIGKFGIDSFRKYIQNDNKLIVLDQILAHYQVLDLR